MITIFNPETFSQKVKHTEFKNMQKATLIFVLLSFAVIVGVMIHSLTIDNDKTYAMEYATETVEPMFVSTYYEGNIIYSQPASEIHTEKATETSQKITTETTTTTSSTTTTTSETTTTTTTQAATEAETEDVQMVEVIEAQPEVQQEEIAVAEKSAEAPTSSASDTTAAQIDTSADATVANVNGDLTYNTRSLNYTYQEYEMLCAVVMHEVGYCSEYSQQLVTSLIVNRVLDGRFGGSIYSILHASGQFTAINNYYSPTIPVTDSVKATVKQVLNSNTDYANGAVFYYAPRWSGYRSYFENKPFVLEYEGQRFFK